MLRCPSCAAHFGEGERFCPADGARLEPATIAGGVAAPAADPLEGRVLDGRYRIERKLGEGGMGAVFRATHVLMAKTLAVKVLRGPIARDPAAARRFAREARSASRLDHAHCIRVTDFGASEDGLLYLVMEHLEGRTLGQALSAGGPLPPARAVRIARQAALGLAHAHELGVIHRDLKPDNIFLTHREEEPDFVKVLDFGLAKLLERETDSEGRPLGTLTEAGTVFGTPEYMSPEQAEGRALDARTDLYSLGIVLYHALTGLLPFQSASFMETLTKHLTERPVPPDERRPDLAIPAALSALVMACLEKDPRRRPADARALAGVLETVDVGPAPPRVRRTIAGLPTEDIPVQAEPAGARLSLPPGARARRALPAIAAALAGSLALAAALLVTARPRRHASDRPDAGRTAAGAAAPGSGVPPGREPGAARVAVEAAVAPATAPDAAAAAGAARPAPAPDAGVPVTAAQADERASAAEHLRLARGFRARGNPIKELYHLQRAAALEPRSAEVLYRLGAALLEADQKSRGCGYLERAGAYPAARALRDGAGCGLVE